MTHFLSHFPFFPEYLILFFPAPCCIEQPVTLSFPKNWGFFKLKNDHNHDAPPQLLTIIIPPPQKKISSFVINTALKSVRRNCWFQFVLPWGKWDTPSSPQSNLSGGPKLLNLKSETEESAVGAAEYLNCDVLQTISNWELEWGGVGWGAQNEFSQSIVNLWHSC